MTQFTLPFDSPSAAEPPLAPAAAPDALSLEQMAQVLAQHADYRVLRRLVPCQSYGPGPEASDAAHPGRVVRVLVLDTETTGLSHPADKIIELAMLLVAVDTATGLPFGPVEVFEGFEDPGMPIPPVAREITGISDDMVRGQRLDDAQVQALIDRADLVIAHNAGFDRPFVEARFPGFAAKPWACSFADIDWKARGAESAKLSALAADHGWFYDAHRALVDCHALLQVLSQPVVIRAASGATGMADANVATTNTTNSTTGLSQLIHAARQPSHILRATGAPFESRDALKARGYRWDAQAKVWFCRVASKPLLQAELDWLKAEVYGGRRTQPEVEALDAFTRYSLRPGVVTPRP